MAALILEHFIPVSINITSQPLLFRRFGAIWTPSVVFLDTEGIECWRSEGYLTRSEFHAQVRMALARTSAMHKRWRDAEERYSIVIEDHSDTSAVPEALYWRGVSRYRQGKDHLVLEEMADEVTRRFPASVWAIKASSWKK